MAISPENQYIHKVNGETQYITQRLSLSADASAVDLNDNLVGGYLFSVEIFTSADDAVTFTINTGIGSPIYTTTTTAATNGETPVVTDRFTINSTPNYTLSGLGSGTITIEIVVAKK